MATVERIPSEVDDPFIHLIFTGEDFTLCGRDFTDSIEEEDPNLTVYDVSCRQCIKVNNEYLEGKRVWKG